MRLDLVDAPGGWLPREDLDVPRCGRRPGRAAAIARDVALVIFAALHAIWGYRGLHRCGETG